jgi:hypothetical protein
MTDLFNKVKEFYYEIVNSYKRYYDVCNEFLDKHQVLILLAVLYCLIQLHLA